MVFRILAFWLSCGLVTFLFVLSSFGAPWCRHLMPTRRAWCCISLLKTDASELLSLLLEIVKPEDLKCVQFLQGGKVHLSFKEKSTRDHLFSEELGIDGFEFPVTRYAEKLNTVYQCDFSWWDPGDNVYEFFGAYDKRSWLLNVPSPPPLPPCDPATVWSRSFLGKMCRISCPFVIAIVECGTVINRLNALFNNYSSSPNGLWVNIAHDAEGRMGFWLIGYKGERNKCFRKIQLVGQNNMETKHLSQVKAGHQSFFTAKTLQIWWALFATSGL